MTLDKLWKHRKTRAAGHQSSKLKRIEEMACLCWCFYRRRKASEETFGYASSGFQESELNSSVNQKFKVIPPVQFPPTGEEKTADGVGSGNNDGGSHSNIWKKITRNIFCASATT